MLRIRHRLHATDATERGVIDMARVMNMGTIVTESIKVNADAVDRELANLWKMAIDGRIPGAAAPVTRAILSNLVVYATSEEEANEAGQAVVELIADHPLRVIITDAGAGKPETKLEADVSMLCNVTDQGRRLCGEEIRFHTHGVASAALGTILPVLVPDLPIYLWTPGDLVWEEQFLSNLMHITDHWIIDSRRFTNLPERFQLAESLAPEHVPPISLHDLAWTSLSQWRGLVAQHFDPPIAREYLNGVNAVTIACGVGQDERPNIESILMAAWLMSRLNWTEPRISRETDGIWAILANADGRDVLIRLRPTADAKLPIEEIVIESEFNGKCGVFSSARADRLDEVSIEVNAMGIPSIRRTIRLDPESLSREVCRVLDSTSRDTLYEQALPIVRELVGQIEGVG